jgi:hypothetical protein
MEQAITGSLDEQLTTIRNMALTSRHFRDQLTSTGPLNRRRERLLELACVRRRIPRQGELDLAYARRVSNVHQARNPDAPGLTNQDLSLISGVPEVWSLKCL